MKKGPLPPPSSLGPLAQLRFGTSPLHVHRSRRSSNGFQGFLSTEGWAGAVHCRAPTFQRVVSPPRPSPHSLVFLLITCCLLTPPLLQLPHLHHPIAISSLSPVTSDLPSNHSPSPPLAAPHPPPLLPCSCHSPLPHPHYFRPGGPIVILCSCHSPLPHPHYFRPGGPIVILWPSCHARSCRLASRSSPPPQPLSTAIPCIHFTIRLNLCYTLPNLHPQLTHPVMVITPPFPRPLLLARGPGNHPSPLTPKVAPPPTHQPTLEAIPLPTVATLPTATTTGNRLPQGHTTPAPSHIIAQQNTENSKGAHHLLWWRWAAD